MAPEPLVSATDAGYSLDLASLHRHDDDAPTVPISDSSDRLIRRDRLLVQLAGSRARVVVLAAPGGYGKSAVLKQWIDTTPRPVVWVSVPESAPDALEVLRLMVDGIRTKGIVSEALVLPSQTDEASWVASLDSLGPWLARAEQEFVLAIDDAERVSGFAWEHLLQRIVDHLPEHSMLALATRGECPVPLRRLRVTEDVLELGVADLAMDEPEVEALLAAHRVALPIGAVLDLKAATEGWPAAVYLSARALRAGQARRGLGPVPPASIDDFIRDEVVTPLSDDDADLLMRCSVLEVLSGPSCDAVSGRSNSIGLLATMARSNQLIIPVEGEEDCFRLHQLLAEHLRREFRRQDLSGFRAAHSAASRKFERIGRPDSAVLHARLAADDDRLGALVLEYSAGLLTTGGTPTLARWLESLEDWRIERSVELALVAAWVTSQQGDVHRCQALMLLLQQRCREADTPQRLRDMVLLLRATLGSEGISQMLDDATGACQRMDEADPWLGLARYLRGCALAMGGQLAEARRELVEADRLTAVHRLPLLQAHVLAALADVALAAQDLSLWSGSVGRVRTLMGVSRVDDVTTAAPIIATSAEAYFLDGQLLLAKDEAQRARRLCAQMHPAAPWAGVQVRVKLARIFLATDAPDIAQQLIREALEIHGPATRCMMIDAAMDEARSLLAPSPREPGDTNTLSTAEVRVLRYLPTHLTFPEIGDRLFVSRNTVKTQAISIYRNSTCILVPRLLMRPGVKASFPESPSAIALTGSPHRRHRSTDALCTWW